MTMSLSPQRTTRIASFLAHNENAVTSNLLEQIARPAHFVQRKFTTRKQQSRADTCLPAPGGGRSGRDQPRRKPSVLLPLHPTCIQNSVPRQLQSYLTNHIHAPGTRRARWAPKRVVSVDEDASLSANSAPPWSSSFPHNSCVS